MADDCDQDAPDVEYDEEAEDHEACGRWINGSLGPRRYCTMAGTEFCDFHCPHNR
jgi:hypothetical protein